MTAYEGINNLDDIGIQAGSDTALFLPCYDAEGQPIELDSATSFGATLSLYGEDDTATQVISGTIKSGTTNTIQIDILSSYTQNLGDCLLVCRPFLEISGKVYRWQGYIFVGATTSYK